MKKVFLILLLIAVVLFSSLTITAEPGDNDDPIVVLSYLEYRLNDLVNYVDRAITKQNETTSQQAIQIENINKKLETVNQSGGSVFEVVEINVGQKIIADAGAEIIIRSGEAFAIDNGIDGLSDITDAKDLTQGTPVPLNHLIIVPRSDGRGIYVESNVFLMIRGSYTIIE